MGNPTLSHWYGKTFCKRYLDYLSHYVLFLTFSPFPFPSLLTLPSFFFLYHYERVIMYVCVSVTDPPSGKWEKWENGHFVRDSLEKVGRFVFSVILHDGIMGKAYKMHELLYNKNVKDWISKKTARKKQW